MVASQVNVRLDSALKRSGDQALSSIGYTPTRAVRALWTFCGNAAHDTKKLRAIFALLEGGEAENGTQDETRMKMKRVEEGPLIFENALREMGVEDLAPSGLSDEELLEQAYRDKWAERGLL